MTQNYLPAVPLLRGAPLPRARPAVQKLCWGTWVLLALACCQSPAAFGQSAGSIDREYPLKAAYLYNFGTYIEWPESAFVDSTSPLVLGILGQNSFGNELDQLVRRRIGSRPITVRHFSDATDISECHILFIAASVSERQLTDAFAKVRGLPILCVGETPGFARAGGDIGFFVQQNKLRFEINIHAARQQGLKISSKLLGVATVVGAEHSLTHGSSSWAP